VNPEPFPMVSLRYFPLSLIIVRATDQRNTYTKTNQFKLTNQLTQAHTKNTKQISQETFANNYTDWGQNGNIIIQKSFAYLLNSSRISSKYFQKVLSPSL
jgi:hypothetical protein